jgi:hypothetical protein
METRTERRRAGRAATAVAVLLAGVCLAACNSGVGLQGEEEDGGRAEAVDDGAIRDDGSPDSPESTAEGLEDDAEADAVDLAEDGSEAGECLYDEDCAEGFLCLEPSGEFPATGATRRSCVPYDGTFEDGPVVGRTGCSADNLVDTDVWGFCDPITRTVRAGDVIRGTLCGGDRVPAYKYPTTENARVELYLSRADESLGTFFVELYRDDCVLRGSSGGIPLDMAAHHGPIEVGFEAGSEGIFVIRGGTRADGTDGTGSFTVHVLAAGTF